jgi:hypothetical protein
MDRITDYLTADHARLEALLARAASLATLDLEAYAEFRSGLLRHIGIEEKLLLSAVKKLPPPVALSVDELHTLRVEHAALTSLLVATPDLALLAEIREILQRHDAREEGEAGVPGLYARCEDALGAASAELAERARAFPAVRVAPHYDGAGAMRTAHDALTSARRLSRPRAEPVG